MKKSILRALEFPHRRGGSDSRHAVGLVIRLVALILLAAVSVQASAETFTNLLSFTGSGGAYPGQVPQDLTLSGTTLYGMTAGGGSSGDGTVFSIGTNGSGFQSLFSFSGTNGAQSFGQLGVERHDLVRDDRIWRQQRRGQCFQHRD